MAAFFGAAVFNSLGFISLNLDDVKTSRAERVSPAVADSQRRLDAITKPNFTLMAP
jgi:hypothetical protein